MSVGTAVARSPSSPSRRVAGGWLRQKAHEAKRERWAYFFVLPAVIIFLLFRIYPALRVVEFAFLRITPLKWSWAGLGNFQTLLDDDKFWVAVRVSFTYTLVVVPVGLAIALFLSVLVFSRRDALQTVFKASFYMPGVASAVVISMVWLWILEPVFGLANYLLSLLGIPPQQWLGDASLALPSLILMTLVTSQGQPVILLTAAMGAIPKDLYEAAHLDGAGPVSEFFQVTLPLLRPTLLYVVVTSTIHAFQLFTPVYVMTKGGPYFATNSLVYYMYELGFNRFQFGMASAVSLCLFAVLIVVSFVYYRCLSTDLEY